MKSTKITLVLLFTMILISGTHAQKNQFINSIAFGSCNKHDLPQPLWKPILADKPDIFVWLGDNVYGDTHNMDLLRAKYEAQDTVAGYLELKSRTKIIGIWDDHDYGINDGGKHYAQKEESMQIMLDFLAEPQDSERRRQQGVYTAYTFGVGDNSVKLFLLDARYMRDTLERENGVYLPNKEGSILGDQQWDWLATELKQSSASVNIIASGIQFIPTEHPYEKWENFPKERQKLFDLISNSKIKNPVLISGDRHIAEISVLKNKQFPTGLYEITSSGMTHTWKEYKQEYNPYRIGNLIASLHYGMVDFDWDNGEMTFTIKGEEGQTYLEQTLPIQ
ncbi:alkaline phosphatase D family protein [Aquiflexum sp.]|uniref:alkaline phosphatase D family protein n=1 Tax=Aquiflexum sp. TaxID=1872584 RepID=UPI003593DE29